MLLPFEEEHYPYLVEWIDDKKINYLWGGPAYQYPLTLEQIASHCDQDKYHPFLFIHQGEPAGYVELFHEKENEYRICRVLISHAWRGRGLANVMLQELMDKAESEYACKRLGLGVFQHNTSAIKCYQSLGFEVVALETGIRQFQGEDWALLFMEKWLEDDK